MANTYYDSQLTAAEIEAVLEAINGILTPANNGKVLAISNGKFEARSVQWGGGEPTIEPLSVTANGTYTAPSGVDGYSPITVNVSGGLHIGSVSLSTNWTGSGPYTQIVTVSGATITANSMVNLQPTQDQINQLSSDGVTVMTTENNNGVITVYATGGEPTQAMTMQCSVYEVTT